MHKPSKIKTKVLKFVYLSEVMNTFIQRYSLKRAFATYLSSVLKDRFLNIYNSNFNSFFKTYTFFLNNVSFFKRKNYFLLINKKMRLSFLYVLYIY